MSEENLEKPSEHLDKALEEKIETFLRNRSKIVHHELTHIKKAGRKFTFPSGLFGILKKIKFPSLLKKPWYHQVATFVVVTALLAGGIWFRHYLVSAATYTWIQSSWSGGASTTAPFPTHPTNETGWNKYYSKGGIDTTSGITLERTSN